MGGLGEQTEDKCVPFRTADEQLTGWGGGGGWRVT